MHRWKYSVLATVATLSAGLHTPNASALALGRVNVQSALGEPLRAEIELPQITTAEADSLAVELASPEVFRAQGMEYSTAAHSVRVRIGNRPDGTLVLLLSSDRPINDPFVDLVIDASWNSGNITRSYTMLLDPPNIPRREATVNTPAQLSGGGNVSYLPPPPSAPAPLPAIAPPAPPPPSSSSSSSSFSATASNFSSDLSGDAVTVRAGDTAGRIARANKPGTVSLDQMLVAMARANPHAFIKGNVNRLRAGVVLQMPSEAEALATPATEARKLIATQSHDFNAYRQTLAGNAPLAEINSPGRTGGGRIQTDIQESKPAQPSSDRLQIVPGGTTGVVDDAEKIALEKQKQEEQNRLEEIKKNIDDLKAIGQGTTTPNPTAPTDAPPPPALGLEVTPPEGLPGLPVDAPPSEPLPEPKPEPEPAPAPPPPARPAPPPPMPQPEPSLLDSLTEDPLLAGGALAVILGLLGFAGWRYKKSKEEEEEMEDESSFFRSGGIGSQQIDSEQSNLTSVDDGSSVMSYSPSQLDAGGDVDPVAEADVYLAYGRDVQAEEILKEASRHHPDRVSIPAKLAEIYAKRQDTVALETVASEVYSLTGGQGPEWNRVCELGRDVDPENTLYSAGKSAVASAPAAGPAPVAFVSTEPAPIAPSSAGNSAGNSVLPDLDLDLALNLPDAPSASPVQPLVSAPPPAPLLDLPLDTASTPATEAPPSSLDFQISGISLLDGTDAAPAPMGSAPAPTPSTGTGSLEFSISDLSLDLDVPTASPVAAGPDSLQPLSAAQPDDDDPLATKLALAEEFSAIGDYDGARSMVEEVIAEATGELKARAQRLLAQMA